MLEKDWLGIIAVSRGSSGSAYECYAWGAALEFSMEGAWAAE